MEGKDTYSSLYGGSWGNAPWDSHTWTKYEQNTGKNPAIVHLGVGTPGSQLLLLGWNPQHRAERRCAQPPRYRHGLCIARLHCFWIAGLRDHDVGEASCRLRPSVLPAPQLGDERRLVPVGYDVVEPEHPCRLRCRLASHARSLRCRRRYKYHVGLVPQCGGRHSVPYTKLYPGDSYVDWTCLNGYNQGSSSQSFSSLYTKSYTDLVALAPSKPVMIGEIGSLRVRKRRQGRVDLEDAESPPTNFPQIKAFGLVQLAHLRGRHLEELGGRIVGSSQTAFSTGIAAPYYAAASSFPMPRHSSRFSRCPPRGLPRIRIGPDARRRFSSGR